MTIRYAVLSLFFLRAELPDAWHDSPSHLKNVASWLLEQNIALEKARELARRAERSSTPIDRLQMMMLEARIASAAGDHAAAVRLMERVDEAVPDNESDKDLLERFRRLRAEAKE